MQDMLRYQTALNYIADVRREVSTRSGKTERRVQNQENSWSSVAFWHTMRRLRA